MSRIQHVPVLYCHFHETSSIKPSFVLNVRRATSLLSLHDLSYRTDLLLVFTQYEVNYKKYAFLIISRVAKEHACALS